VAIDVPGFEVKFRIPRGLGDLRLLSASRAIARHATKWAPGFVDHGLPPAFLDELASSVARLEQALRVRASARHSRISAGVNLKTSLRRGLLAVRRLDAVVLNVLGEDRMALDRWQRARRLERSRRSRHRAARPPRSADLYISASSDGH
jgi:hypothetical protein